MISPTLHDPVFPLFLVPLPSYLISKENVSREHVKYITYRNNFTRIKRKQREICYGNLYQQYKSNLKKTWSTLNEILNRKKNGKTSISNSFQIDNTIENDPPYIVDKFNELFSEIGPKYASNISPSSTNYQTYMSTCKKATYFRPTDSKEIINTINSLKLKTSCGHDNVNTLLLKHKICHIITT